MTEPTSDFHLVESTDGWTLTINVTRHMLDSFGEAAPGKAPSRADQDAGFTVHVEPNLLPAEPFAVQVVILRK